MSVETSEDRIALYLKLAAEARSMASKIGEPGTGHDLMLEVADTWDRLAHLESIDLERKVGRSSS
jgi:hypothetical protein